MNTSVNSASESDASERSENTYCVFLHIVEGIGLGTKDIIGDYGNQRIKSRIILNASLNGVRFEVEGHISPTGTATIFNSNCIWECELNDIKRMKTDNRPVKVECYVKSGCSDHSPRRSIGSLLLPIRSVQTVSNLANTTLKLHWHKLSALGTEWRHNKPEIYLLLMIVKKSHIESGKLGALLGKHKITNPASNPDILSPNISETAYMLESQSNVYVQLLEQVGLIQVGNNPDVDCDIFCVTLIFKHIKNVLQLLELGQNNCRKQNNTLVFYYDFLGSTSQLEILTTSSDCYTINEKISLSFKSSLRSLRIYFQRIFYIPINLYLNGIAIANYRFDFSKLLPDDLYFNTHKLWTKNGTFFFDLLHKILSPRAVKPSVDFTFNIHLLNTYSNYNNYDMPVLNETFLPYKNDENSYLELRQDCYRNLNTAQIVQLHRRLPYDVLPNSCHINNFEMSDKIYREPNSEYMMLIRKTEIKDDLYSKLSEEMIKENSSEMTEIVYNPFQKSFPKQTSTVCVETIQNQFCTVGVNTELNVVGDGEEFTLKLVQELEEWKAQQMEEFLMELSRKENAYLLDVQTKWEQKCSILQNRLEAKIAKCEQIYGELEKAHIELNSSAIKTRESINIVNAVKHDIERNYAQKFQELDIQMQRLKMELQQRGSIYEIKNKQVQIENTRLEREKVELKERIDELEKQLAAIQSTHLSTGQLKDVLDKLRLQNDRFVAMEKSKNYYKEQWAKSNYEVQKLKVKFLEMREEKCLLSQNNSEDFEFCLEEILNDEQEVLQSDRTELKTIKEILFSSSSTSSECECEGGSVT